jgi:hypothetical protein
MTEEYMPKKEVEHIKSDLEVKIDNTAYIINTKVDSSMERLIEHLDRIEAQTTKTNGRVSQLEMESGLCRKDLDKVIVEVSGVNTIALRIKTERDQEREDRIKEQALTISKLQERDEKVRSKIIIGIIMAVLAIASFIGLINADFVKSIPIL